ncbi:hypothetical protein FB382_002457 [Nocardioides ginsengisegetis]|uniref:Uncharacterized protein n=1 Tax=Nocardioides ginsengisegetis TaxID=661491 RepID=A0A7W3J0T6_9ACTN|nr:hypothetical protein [Nocardioides ginsengisegetis]MBA8804166.1 hypothetical protein [Nocardioides ginsengisegetis]
MDTVTRRAARTIGFGVVSLGLVLGLASAGIANVGRVAEMGSEYPPLSSEAKSQLAKDSFIEVTAFDPARPSIVRPTRDTEVDHNKGLPPLSVEEAVKMARDAVGLSDNAVVASASLVSVTPHAYGYELAKDTEASAILPIFEGTASWAIEFADLLIPVADPRYAEEANPPAAERLSYMTNMVIFVDAYDGSFMLGGQFDPNPEN